MENKSLEAHLSCIQSAQKHLEGVLDPTGLIYSDYFSSQYSNHIYLKPENLQRTGAFKIRGAYNRIAELTEEERAKGIITASAGNHAQGVSYASRAFKAPCTIVMPETTPLIKIESAKEKGANIVLFGASYDEAYNKALSISKETGATFVHAYDDYGVIYGQGTIALEMLAEIPELDEIIVPIGGGGLISGIALAAKAIKPSIRIIGVEPEGADSMSRSLAKGEITVLDRCQTCAEGVAVKKVGENTLACVKDYVDGIITVPEEDIMEAVLLLIEKHKLVAEASGVLPLAALKHLNTRNKNVGCVISGGNIDMVTISSMINTGLVTRGRIFAFTVELPDKPGELLEIATILSNLRANVIALDHNQFKATDRYQKVLLEVTAETNGPDHIKEIMAALSERGYEIKRSY